MKLTNLPTEPLSTRKVKLPNGHTLTTSATVSNLQWCIRGHTHSSDMLVMDMAPYDAILGYDWLKKHSPMQCDWEQKTITFSHKGKPVTIQGIITPPLSVTPISATKLYKATRGNDTWAFVIVDSAPQPDTTVAAVSDIHPEIQDVIDKYEHIFHDPQTLPPSRSYDHAIPQIPGAVPVNTRPYHYSPQHKTEIEAQVTQLLEKGLITHSHSPFASLVLLVKKKDGTWRFCIDYRRLNDITTKNRFPMPIIEEILDELAGAKYFTKLDMRSSYHQV